MDLGEAGADFLETVERWKATALPRGVGREGAQGLRNASALSELSLEERYWS